MSLTLWTTIVALRARMRMDVAGDDKKKTKKPLEMKIVCRTWTEDLPVKSLSHQTTGEG